MSPPGPLAGYLLALGLTLALEVPIAIAFFPGCRGRIALASLSANLATHLLLHVAFPHLLPSRRAALVAGEAFATLAEAAVYAVVGRDPGRALVASALANAASFGAGLALWG